MSAASEKGGDDEGAKTGCSSSRGRQLAKCGTDLSAISLSLSPTPRPEGTGVSPRSPSAAPPLRYETLASPALAPSLAGGLPGLSHPPPLPPCPALRLRTRVGYVSTFRDPSAQGWAGAHHQHHRHHPRAFPFRSDMSKSIPRPALFPPPQIRP